MLGHDVIYVDRMPYYTLNPHISVDPMVVYHVAQITALYPITLKGVIAREYKTEDTLKLFPLAFMHHYGHYPCWKKDNFSGKSYLLSCAFYRIVVI